MQRMRRIKGAKKPYTGQSALTNLCGGREMIIEEEKRVSEYTPRDATHNPPQSPPLLPFPPPSLHSIPSLPPIFSFSHYSRERAHNPRQGGGGNHPRAINGPLQVHAFDEGQVDGQVGADAEVDADAHHGYVEVAAVGVGVGVVSW